VVNDKDPEAQDPVWLLLKQARPVEVRPQFSRDVLQAIRHEAETKSARWVWLRALWTPRTRPVWLAATAALVLAGWWEAHRPHGSEVRTTTVMTPGSALDPTDELADQIASELAMLDEIDGLLAPESAHDLGEEDIERVLF
jgi:hypothetical protein